MKVLQLLQTLAFGDAVSNDARAIDALLKKKGYDAAIYAKEIDERLSRDVAHPYAEMPKLGKEDVLIYHLSIGSDLIGLVQKASCRKMMIYHNVTPARFFTGYSDYAESLCRLGAEDVKALNHTFDYCQADSDFNRQELLDAGYDCSVDVRPILIPFEDYAREPDKETVARYSDGRTNILFVGRLAPNKKQEDVIRAFACYKKTVDPHARLILAGSAGGMDLYKNRLDAYIKALGVEDVIFPGHISFPQILALYRTASVFLCMSEHEGFCVPLVEAMYFDVPVVAYGACAVPGTLGGSGLLLDKKDPLLAAAVMDRVVTDGTLRAFVLEKQRQRLADFSYETVSTLFLRQFETFLKGENQ